MARVRSRTRLNRRQILDRHGARRRGECVAARRRGNDRDYRAGRAAVRSALPPDRDGRRRRGRHRHMPRRRPRHAQLRLHGRRHQVARHRLCAAQSRLEFSRPARIADQLRRQQESGIHHLHARGILGRHGARLFQDRGQAAAGAGARHGRPAARRDGDLQRLVRSRAGHRHAAATISMPRKRAAAACRHSIRRRTSTRWCATSPSGTISRCRCSISPNPSCAPTRSR